MKRRASKKVWSVIYNHEEVYIIFNASLKDLYHFSDKGFNIYQSSLKKPSISDKEKSDLIKKAQSDYNKRVISITKRKTNNAFRLANAKALGRI